MQALAVIPARGGSKGIPKKNIRPLCGKPLIAWTIEAAKRAREVARVVVSTDDVEIAEVSRRFGAEVVGRPHTISRDDSPSEAALLHTLEHLQITHGRLVFLQCTSPLTLPEDIDGTVALLREADSAVTASTWHHFLWRESSEGAVPLGHCKGYRPMRQEMERQYVEVGAVYAMRIEGFLVNKRRFFGRTGLYLIPPERSIEIDEPFEFLLAERLMRQRLEQERASFLPGRVEAIITDFDGVMTDNRLSVDESARESVVCHKGDGWAVGRLREKGLRLLVLTNEANPVVKARCDKLGVECLVAAGDKLPVLQDWLRREGVDPRFAVYVGNDIPDVPCMGFVGCGVAPADAYPAATRAARLVLNARGGDGCIRELAELLKVGDAR